MAPAKEVVTVEAETLKDLVQSVRDIADVGQRNRQLTVAEIDWVTPWNPTGKKNRLKLRVPMYQNGARIDEDRVTEDEIALLNQIKPGRYNNGKWAVVRRQDKSLDFRYPNKSVEQRFELMALSKGQGISGLLKVVIDEHAARLERKKAGILEEEDDDY